MNFLKFNKYLQSDNDGTFWPGYIEIPDDEGLPSEYDTGNEEKGNRFTSNPRVFTCLLYTSPSPRDQRGSRMPSSA